MSTISFTLPGCPRRGGEMSDEIWVRARRGSRAGEAGSRHPEGGTSRIQGARHRTYRVDPLLRQWDLHGYPSFAVCAPRRRSSSSLDNRHAKQLFLLLTRALEIERVRVAPGAERAQGSYHRRRGPIRTSASWVRVSSVTSRATRRVCVRNPVRAGAGAQFAVSGGGPRGARVSGASGISVFFAFSVDATAIPTF